MTEPDDNSFRAADPAPVAAAWVFSGVQVLLVVAVVAMLLFGTASGCYEVSRPAEEEVYVRYARWVPAVVLGVSLSIGLLGAWLVITPGRVRAGLAALGVALLGAALIAPSIAFDLFEVTPDHLRQRTGFWFFPNAKGFEIDGRAPPVVVIGQKLRRGTFWTIYKPDGTSERVDPGDLWENNEQLAVEVLQANGVIVGRE